MNPVRIALIDSGVERNHTMLCDKIIQQVRISHDEESFKYQNSINDLHGHGTAMAGIIFDKCPDIELLSIQILNQDLESTTSLLAKGLEFAISEQVDIINLSLGTCKSEAGPILRELCQRARKQGIYLVAALSNDQDELSMPAIFPEVFGVRSGPISEKYGYYYRPDSHIQVQAKGVEQKVCWKQNSTHITKGNSLASAHFAGILANFLANHSNLDWLALEKLIMANQLPDMAHPSIQGTEWIGKALLFPASVENLEMLAMEGYLDHEIVGIYDPRRFYYDYFEYQVAESKRRIPLFDQLDVGLEGVDTVLIGDLDFLPELERKKWMRQVVETAISKGVSIFSKDPLPPDEYGQVYRLAREKGLKIQAKFL